MSLDLTTNLRYSHHAWKTFGYLVCWLFLKGCLLLQRKKAGNERLVENVPKGTVSAPSPIPSLPPSASRERETGAQYKLPFVNLPQ